MCILFIALGEHPRYPLIVAANRDEEFARPSREAHYWQESPNIYGGRDLQAGGSWLAVNHAGEIAAITNLRMPELYRQDARSRGELVSQFLDRQSDTDFRQGLERNRQLYNPFNLLFGSAARLQVFNSASGRFATLAKGFHAVSNGPVDDVWPKMSRGVSLLETHVMDRTDRELDLDRLFNDMFDTTEADASLLPETGVGLEVEKRLSSIFIVGDGYGTRTTSVLCFGADSIAFYERNYGPKGTELGLTQATIALTRGE